MSRISRTSLGAWFVVVPLLLTGCYSLSGSKTRSAGDVDPKIDNTSFVEEGDLVALIAGTRVAYARRGSAYFPLEVAVVNRGLEGLSLTAEAFTLIDQDGTSYPVVDGKEVARATNVDVDRRLSTLPAVVRGRYGGYRQVPGTLTTSFDRPIPSTLQIPRFSWAHELLYFPRPAGGIRGRQFELFLKAGELEEPVFVRFEVAGKEEGSR